MRKNMFVLFALVLLTLLTTACVSTTTTSNTKLLAELEIPHQQQVWKHKYISDNLNDFKFYNELTYTDLRGTNNLTCLDEEQNKNFLVKCIENVYVNEKGFIIELKHDFCIFNLLSDFQTRPRNFMGSTVYNDIADAKLYRNIYKKYILVNTENRLFAIVNVKRNIMEDKNCIKKSAKESKCLSLNTYYAMQYDKTIQKVLIGYMSNTLSDYVKSIYEKLKQQQITDNSIFKNICGKIALVNYKKRFSQGFKAYYYIESLYEHDMKYELAMLAHYTNLESIRDILNNSSIDKHMLTLDMNYNQKFAKYFNSLHVNHANMLQVNNISQFVDEFFKNQINIKIKKYVDKETGHESYNIYVD